MDYRQRPELSYSDLLWLNKSPLHFKNRHLLQKETEAMRKGTLLHMGVLEPEKFKNSYAIEPEEIDGQPINRRIKAHREFLDHWRQTSEGKIFIRQSDMDSLINMFNAIAMHKYAKQFLTGGTPEVEAYGEWDGVKLKGKCDYLVDLPGFGRTVVDLKKTQDASFKGFERSIYNYSYHLQAKIYTHLFKADSFFFIAVEDNGTPICPIGIYRASDVLIEKGEQMLSRLIKKYQQCEQTGEYHGYTDHFADISLPAWSVAQEE